MVDLAQAFSEIKSLPDHELHKALKSPSGAIPGWLALGEIHERKLMRATSGGGDPDKRPSMAEEYAGSAQPQLSPPPPQMPPMPPMPSGPGGGIAALPQQGYANGGIVSLANGGSIRDYIYNAAIRQGVDPNIAIRVAQSEGGLNDIVRQSDYINKHGVREQSYGPFQLYLGGGLGNRALAAGIDPRKPEHGYRAIDFALAEAKNKGWGQWYGAAKAGIGNWQGINGRGGGAYPEAGSPIAYTPEATVAGQTADAAAKMAAAEGGATGAGAVMGTGTTGDGGSTAGKGGGGDAISQYLMMTQLMGKGTAQPQAAPQAAPATPGRPMDARQFVQNPEFLRRRGYG